MSLPNSNALLPRFAPRHFVAATAAAAATAAQLLWAAPDAPVADPAASALPYLLVACLWASVMTLVWLALLRSRRVAARTAVVVLSLAAYWLLLNYGEFMVRVAAWSTFDSTSVALHVLAASALPVAVCAAVLLFVVSRVLRS